MTEPQPTAEDLKNLPNLEQVVLDELVAEFKEQHNKQMNAILIHPEVYASMKYNRPMNFWEKLQAGWYWFGECFEEWCYTMTHDDGELFNYLQSDYVAYEEDMYYE